MKNGLAASTLLVAAALPLALPAQPAGAPEPAPRRRIVVTAFEPFGGRAVNNSARIAEALRTSAALPPDLDVTVCLLPVVYDVAAARARECIDALDGPPERVVSLGEAGCQLRLETAAHNRDDTPGFADNAGNVRTGHTIVPGGPASIGFDLPVQDLYCALPPEDRQDLDISKTPGGFVCNNTAYLLATHFRGTGIRYAFVHVPASDFCGAEAADPTANAARLARMLGHVEARERVSPSGTYALPHCSNEERLPTTLEEISRAASSILDAAGQAECQREFLDRLKKRY